MLTPELRSIVSEAAEKVISQLLKHEAETPKAGVWSMWQPAPKPEPTVESLRSEVTELERIAEELRPKPALEALREFAREMKPKPPKAKPELTARGTPRKRAYRLSAEGKRRQAAGYRRWLKAKRSKARRAGGAR